MQHGQTTLLSCIIINGEIFAVKNITTKIKHTKIHFVNDELLTSIETSCTDEVTNMPLQRCMKPICGLPDPCGTLSSSIPS